MMVDIHSTIFDLEIIKMKPNSKTFIRAPESSDFNESDGILKKCQFEEAYETNMKYHFYTQIIRLENDENPNFIYELLDKF